MKLVFATSLLISGLVAVRAAPTGSAKLDSLAGDLSDGNFSSKAKC
jgi:hypothetical protein